MTALLISPLHQGALCASIYPAVTAARAMGGDVDVLITGDNTDDAVTTVATIEGVRTVLVALSPDYAVPLAESIALLVMEQAQAYSHIIMAANTTGKDCLPRIAALLDVQQVSDIVEVVSSDTFVRPIYAGNALETVQSLGDTHIVSIRPTAFDKAQTHDANAAIKEVNVPEYQHATRFVSQEQSGSDRPDLASASIVVSGGRGVGSSENFDLINALADKLGAAVGASRAAVDAGYVPNDYQVGQTGKVVAPELYIAVGISGAIQHLAGMKESKVIVAINKDESAPIFDIADYGLVGDLFILLPELTEKL